jgi:hypothetical protein
MYSDVFRFIYGFIQRSTFVCICPNAVGGYLLLLRDFGPHIICTNVIIIIIAMKMLLGYSECCEIVLMKVGAYCFTVSCDS